MCESKLYAAVMMHLNNDEDDTVGKLAGSQVRITRKMTLLEERRQQASERRRLAKMRAKEARKLLKEAKRVAKRAKAELQVLRRKLTKLLAKSAPPKRPKQRRSAAR